MFVIDSNSVKSTGKLTQDFEPSALAISHPGFIPEYTAELARVIAAGQTDGAKQETSEANFTYVTRNWVNQAAANEWEAFVIALATSNNLPQPTFTFGPAVV